MELDAIRSRNTDTAHTLIESGGHRGGTIPADYRSEQTGPKNPRGENTWRLVPDDGEGGLAPVLRDVMQRLADGERSASVIADLNARGVPTSKDRENVLSGRESQSRELRAANFRRLLQSPTIIGLSVYGPIITDNDSKPTLNSHGSKKYGEEQIVFKDGVPQQRAEPLVPAELFYAAKAKIEERTQKQDGSRRANAPAMLTDVAFCGTCGMNLYRNVRTDRRDAYRCNSSQRGKTCGNGTMICEVLDGAVSEQLLHVLRNFPHVRREYRQGTKNGTTIVQIDAQPTSIAWSASRSEARPTKRR